MRGGGGGGVAGGLRTYPRQNARFLLIGKPWHKGKRKCHRIFGPDSSIPKHKRTVAFFKKLVLKV